MKFKKPFQYIAIILLAIPVTIIEIASSSLFLPLLELISKVFKKNKKGKE